MFSENPSYALIVTDASIKNNVATSIVYIYTYNRPVVKTLHYMVNITSMEAGSFAIRCGINQVTNIQGISKIIVIIDSIYFTQRIFNILHYPFQFHSVSILKELRKFFVQNHGNSIKF